jgi:formamidopyrimidine-DNA glycosylase
MPEGPEVKITSEILNSELAGQKVTEVTQDLSDLLNLRLLQVTSHGKKIFFEFESLFLVSSLSLSGSWNFFELKHTKSIITFETKKLYYDDIRGFGDLEILSKTSFGKLEDIIADYELGPDVLKTKLSFQEFKERISKHKRSTLFNLLTNQKFLAGIGWYLMNEIAYKAKLLPMRKVSSLSEEELLELYEAVYSVPLESYENSGVYLNPYGQKGFYQPHVYGRKDPEVTRKKVNGRTLYYIESLQH